MNVTSPVPAPVSRAHLLCFSHLRWDFVFQRPQHLMTRAAHDFDVTVFEEAVFQDVAQPTLQLRPVAPGLTIATPVLARSHDRIKATKHLLDAYLARERGPVITWYYSPLALESSRHLKPAACVYDCMDELSAFLNAPRELRVLELELFRRADVVFTGGLSLQDAKEAAHPNVQCFPSSIEMEHFVKARQPQPEPAAQAGIGGPRVGFFGVIDERMDIGLVASVAAAAPELQFVMIGPVVKIDPASLPQAANIHWLGQQSYADLPKFMAHWQAGWMPFALNESTRFISPTKTPEFLAAGLPLASTAVPDVVRTYGDAGFVTIADASSMVGALRDLLKPRKPRLQSRIDTFLARGSWDRTWAGMAGHIREARLATGSKRERVSESKVL